MMLRKTITFTARRALAALLPLALLAACAPAPSVTTLGAVGPADSRPLQVQNVFTAVIERTGIEPSPFHEVKIDEGFDAYIVVPVAERASIPEGIWTDELIPDPEHDGRFTMAEDPDDARITHLGYNAWNNWDDLDWNDWDDQVDSLSPMLEATRDGLVATHIGFGRDYVMRLTFPQVAQGPITVRGTTATAALVRYEGEDWEPVVYRQFTFDPAQLATVTDAKAAVVEFRVTNASGKPFNGLRKEHIHFVMTTPEKDEANQQANPDANHEATPFDALEAIGDGQYRIRVPFYSQKESGSLRFKVEVVSAGAPINATFYRR
jgi:hypothetical protein